MASKTSHTTAVRLADVAREARVSRTTAAQVLLGSGGSSVRVSPATAARIRKAAARLDYRPNITARQLAGGRSMTLGVLIDSHAPPIHFLRLTAIERAANDRGYSLLIGQSHDDPDKIEKYLQQFSGRGVDGVIALAHDYPDHARRLSETYGQSRRVVFVQRPAFHEVETYCAYVDLARGIGMAMEHLVERGRRRIAILLLNHQGQSMRQRHAGYVAGLARLGLASEPALVRRMATQTLGLVQAEVSALLQQAAPDAILAYNDQSAAMTLKALRQLGRRVPDDVAVVGLDNIELAELVEPALTTIDQNNAALAEATLALMERMIEEDELPVEQRQIVIAPRLVVREST